MSTEVPRLGEDFNVSLLQIGGYAGWLVCLPKKTKHGVIWQSVAWRVAVDDAIAEAHIRLARENAA